MLRSYRISHCSIVILVAVLEVLTYGLMAKKGCVVSALIFNLTIKWVMTRSTEAEIKESGRPFYLH